jgi:hypothetical protein
MTFVWSSVSRRWRAIVLSGLATLAALTIVSAGFASAAQPFRTSGCTTYYNITQCGESWGMVKNAEGVDLNPAGNGDFISNWHLRFDVYVDGVFNRSVVDNDHALGKYKFANDVLYPVPQINHPRFRESYTLADGTTCSFTFQVMYHDDQIIQDMEDFSCSP